MRPTYLGPGCTRGSCPTEIGPRPPAAQSQEGIDPARIFGTLALRVKKKLGPRTTTRGAKHD